MMERLLLLVLSLFPHPPQLLRLINLWNFLELSASAPYCPPLIVSVMFYQIKAALAGLTFPGKAIATIVALLC